MLGYLTQEKALSLGLTHHARLYGLIPCYVGGIRSGMLLLEFKHPALAMVKVALDPLYMLACWVSGREQMIGIQRKGPIRRKRA
ncbi:hypothetical protein [Kushneria indalinina]|uniref:Uncharacterized protein n=1 Tax=Kushneria indalinina DSM 14324 TaxID=1122140 RepID=A0A3D9DVU1_9GAMM|nr:hypothetical protein [Kushneria indalinina]REC94878.1 hypothetical protein C8D72_1707 [Kushneria indalinina DSM 14324]